MQILEELPESFSKLPSLKKLLITDCPDLKRSPEDFISLAPLEVLEFEDVSLDPPSMQVLVEMSRKDVTWHNGEVNRVGKRKWPGSGSINSVPYI